MANILILVAMFALLWAVLIRPQKAKQQRQQQLLATIEPGDEVLTVGGMFGIVQAIDEDDELIVEIAEGVHVRIARRAVSTVVKPDEDEEEVEATDEGEDVEPAAEADERLLAAGDDNASATNGAGDADVEREERTTRDPVA